MAQSVIGIVCGTRPEIIKLAPVYLALRGDPRLDVRWIHTGQHGDMAADMLRCFGITPDVQLTRHGASLEAFSLECRAQLDALLAAGTWDLCIVQGDTESAFLGALAAFYRKVPVAHVEAGLRTHNLERPFPEEGLRQMISRLACMHFAPTERARAALLREGIEPEKILLTGNTVVDAQQWIVQKHDIRRQGAPADGHILVTSHRREHWGEEMENIFHAVADIARSHPQANVVFPVHLNPLVQRPAHSILQGLPNVRLATPFDYLGMQEALVNASLLLTDSGGLQEEAPTFGVPTLVLRRETERPEAVEAGCARIVGSSREAIVRAASELLGDPDAANAMRRIANPFGDGQAARRIAEAVHARLGLPTIDAALEAA